MGKFSEVSHIKTLRTENSGGGCMLDVITLKNGKVVCISGDGVGVYDSEEDIYVCSGTEVIQYIDFDDVKPQLPDWPVDHPVWVRDSPNSEWVLGHFKEFSTDGLCVMFGKGRTSHTAKSVNYWEHFTDEDPNK